MDPVGVGAIAWRQGREAEDMKELAIVDENVHFGAIFYGYSCYYHV